MKELQGKLETLQVKHNEELTIILSEIDIDAGTIMEQHTKKVENVKSSYQNKSRRFKMHCRILVMKSKQDKILVKVRLLVYKKKLRTSI